MDFIRITKRDNLSRKKEILITLLAIVLSIVFAGIILLIFGLNPFEIFKEIIMGSVGTGLRVNANHCQSSASDHHFDGYHRRI